MMACNGIKYEDLGRQLAKRLMPFRKHRLNKNFEKKKEGGQKKRRKRKESISKNKKTRYITFSTTYEAISSPMVQDYIVKDMLEWPV